MESIVQKDVTKEGITISRNVNRILIEIIIPAHISEKDKLKEIVYDLNTQLNKSQRIASRVGVLWGVREKETAEEQMAVLKEKAHCKYMVVIEDLDFDRKNYIATLLKKVQLFEESYQWMKENKVEFQKSKPKPETTQAPIALNPTGAESKPSEQAKIIPINGTVEKPVKAKKTKKVTTEK